MKIRIKGNSLRYRLTKSDVDRLHKTGYIEETTDFGAVYFTYSLQRYSIPELTACYHNNCITVFIPTAWVDEWVNTGRVGFSAADKQLSLLVEKDFVCLDDVAEDPSDNYPNPILQIRN